MSHLPSDDALRTSLLMEGYNAGKSAALNPMPAQAVAAFERQYAGDREMIHEFERGMREQRAGLRSYEGVLLEHGKAKYNNDPREKMNYFVTLDTVKGPVTIWGVDLERAIASGGMEVGDPVHIAFQGSKNVEVEVNVLDSEGNVVGTNQITTPRNVWTATKLDRSELVARQSLHSGASVSAMQPATRHVSSLLGGSGLGGLKKLLSLGGSRVNATVADYSEQRAALDLSDAFNAAGAMVASINSSGLSALADPTMGEDAKSDLIKAFMADPRNQAKVKDLASQLDKLGSLSEVVVSKALVRGRDEKVITQKVLDPIHEFKAKHETLLKALHDEGRSLYERLDGIAQRLVSFLRDVLDRVRAAFGLGDPRPETTQPGPGM